MSYQKTVEEIELPNGLKFKYVLYSFEGSPILSKHNLYIPGWLATAEIWEEIVITSGQSSIIFDPPGIGINRVSNNSDESILLSNFREIYLDFVKILITKYEINYIVGTSAGSAFLCGNYDMFSDRKILISAPQITIDPILDNCLRVIALILFYVEKTTNTSLFANVITTKIARKIWFNFIAAHHTRNETEIFINKCIDTSTKKISLLHFLSFQADKRAAKGGLAELLAKNRVHIYVGENDRILDVRALRKLLVEVGGGDDKLTIGKGNHIVETESVAEIVNQLQE